MGSGSEVHGYRELPADCITQPITIVKILQQPMSNYHNMVNNSNIELCLGCGGDYPGLRL